MAARLYIALERVLPFALLLVYLAQLTMFIMAGGLESLVYSSDFMPTIAAAQMITEGHGASIYDFGAQYEAQQRVLAPYIALEPDGVLPFIHPPYEALLILPFMAQSYVAVTLYWILLLAIALCAALLLLQRTLPLQQPWLLLVIICAVSYQPVFISFILGQNSPLVLLGICLVYAAMRRAGAKWDMWAGIGMALITLKVQVLPLILLLVLMEGRWKALLWFGAEMALLVVLCMPFLGALWPLEYLRALLEVSEWGRNALITPAFMHNWRGFALDTVGVLSSSGANVLAIVLTVLSLLLFLYAWWQRRRRANSLLSMDTLWALGVVTAILISPHLHLHDLMLLIFPAWVMVYVSHKGDLSPRLHTIWSYLLKALYLVVAVAFFFGGDSTLWVVLNVSLLAFSTGLLLVTIQSTNVAEGNT